MKLHKASKALKDPRALQHRRENDHGMQPTCSAAPSHTPCSPYIPHNVSQGPAYDTLSLDLVLLGGILHSQSFVQDEVTALETYKRGSI